MSLSLPLKAPNGRQYSRDSMDCLDDYSLEHIMSLSRVLVSQNGRQYSRDSFDRFGDDLCEHLLSYLCFKDKFRFECVSKQWQRLVFNKVSHFDHNSLWPKVDRDYRFKGTFEVLEDGFYITKSVTEQHLKTALKKCKNVKTIAFNVSQENVSSLPLMADCCPRLKSIELHFDENVSSEEKTQLCQILGSKVEEISILLSDTSLIPLCPNLKRLNIVNLDNGNDWVSLIDNQLVPTLKLNTLSRVWVRPQDMPQFIRLMDKYKDSLKNIVVAFRPTDNIDHVFQQLYRIKDLESIDLDIQTTEFGYLELDLTERITALSENCPKLRKISIDYRGVKASPPSRPMTRIKCFTILCFKISDDFVDNISTLMPELKRLCFNFQNIYYTNKDFDSLSRLKRLNTLGLGSAQESGHSVDESAIIQLLDNCKQLNELNLWFRSNITPKTNELKELVTKKMKEGIRFSVDLTMRGHLIMKPYSGY